jgi:hypothetical protein
MKLCGKGKLFYLVPVALSGVLQSAELHQSLLEKVLEVPDLFLFVPLCWIDNDGGCRFHFRRLVKWDRRGGHGFVERLVRDFHIEVLDLLVVLLQGAITLNFNPLYLGGELLDLLLQR